MTRSLSTRIGSRRDDLAAVDLQHLAGDVGGIGPGQKAYDARDLLGRADAAQRNAADDPLAGLRPPFGEGHASHLGVGQADRHRIRPDPAPPLLARHHAHHRLEPGLGGGALHVARLAHLRGDRRDRHDRAAAGLAQVRQGRADGVNAPDRSTAR